ncbi:protein halfway [Planococcus citri]|uniref:protein halfway n=1 Tax=Planococcus citri TaxID=170843 RepID=UPI0031FA400A
MQVSWSFWLLNISVIIVFLPVFTYCDDLKCFNVPPENCTEELRLKEKCIKTFSDSASKQIHCCNVTNESEITSFLKEHGGSDKITGFHLRYSNLTRLHQNVFISLQPHLVSLSITETSILQWQGTFNENWQINCFNFSHNILGSNISSQFIANLTKLKNFDISNSNISEIPELPGFNSSEFFLDVSGNLHMACGGLVRLTTDKKKTKKSLTFVNKNETTCVPPDALSVKIKLEDVERGVSSTFDNCPEFNNRKCECSVASLDQTKNDKDAVVEVERPYYVYQSLVNCSNLGMNSLPTTLPPYTRILDVSSNSITSLEGIGNETFSSLTELYADNNQIKTLKHLEATDFLGMFQQLTVRNNSIDQIQEYLFSNVFDRSSGGGKLMLAKNYFKCDCTTASKIKIWLMANRKNVPDFDQIYANCDNYQVKVIDLNPKNLCAKPHTFKDYIRYIIGLEVLMFVLLIGKVSYDYYVFKTAGYLPWPASKMPKLPCDWCFET